MLTFKELILTTFLMCIFISGMIKKGLWLGVLSMAIVLGILPHSAFSQEIKHTFKIIGKERISRFHGSRVDLEQAVEYDPNSPDHLYILDFKDKTHLLEKSQFLFTGKKFDLSECLVKLGSKELIRDGIQTKFTEDQLVAVELLYNKGALVRQTTFYRNGNKQMTYLGDEKAINGEFKMWFPDGKLSFSGNYRNSLKDGDFESFDPLINQNRKGVYAEGKLISGESVVQDFVYDAPEVPAKSIVSDSILNNYLKMKTADLPVVKVMDAFIAKEINLKLTIGKTGKIDELSFLSKITPSDSVVVNTIIKEFPNFQPALLEGAPVRSTRKLNLVLSNQGLQIQQYANYQTAVNENDSIDEKPYLIVEEMPEFPGGEMALRRLIAQTVRYPREAQEKGIQGKVYVNFIILEDGSVANIKIAKGVHYTLNAEAIYVVKQMPKWKPGRQKGKAVKVSYTVPINFVLN